MGEGIGHGQAHYGCAWHFAEGHGDHLLQCAFFVEARECCGSSLVERGDIVTLGPVGVATGWWLACHACNKEVLGANDMVDHASHIP